MSVNGLSFNLWGVQINTGTLAAGYQTTTSAAVLTLGGVTLSFPDPAHTHANGAGQTVTSGAGSGHTHLFTGSGVPDPPNEVFLPYLRR